MLSPDQMFKLLDTSMIITDEMLSVLKELDVTNSRVTQASLNSMLLGLRKRIIKGEEIVLQQDNTIFKNKHIFDAWVQNTFDAYSVKLYMSSI